MRLIGEVMGNGEVGEGNVVMMNDRNRISQ